MRAIQKTDMLVVVKDSKIDYDCRRLKLSPDKLFRFYKNSGYTESKMDAIHESHDLQQQGKKVIAGLFPPEQIITRAQLTADALRRCKLAISFGGDNHQQFLARSLTTTPILAINADPPRSEGALTQITVNQLPQAVDAIGRRKFAIEEWTRFNIKLGTATLPYPVLCEAFFGEHTVENMSRLAIHVNSTTLAHKGSGMLVYTGAGSTGWAHSVERITFPKTGARLRYLLMHPYVGRFSPSPATANAFFVRGTEFSITSLNDSNGVIILDAMETYPFPEGSKAAIVIGPYLKVIIPQI
jgi:NAD kinase